MKTLKLFLNLTLLFCLNVACSSINEEDNLRSTEHINSLEQYIEFGNIHNKLLDIANNVCSEASVRSGDFSFMGDDAGLFEIIHKEQIASVHNLSINDTEKELLINSLNNYVTFYHTDSLYNKLISTDSMESIALKIKNLSKNKIIDSFEEKLLDELYNAIIDNHDTGDHEALFSKIENLCTRWDNHYGLMATEAGVISGYILGISKSSMNWWKDNYTSTRAIPAWVAADAGGAIVSGVVNAGIQYGTTKRVDMKQVAYHALAGAVIASTGIVKAVGAWVCAFL